MRVKTKVREWIIRTTGYWIYKKDHLPVGCDRFNDLKYKICLPLKTVFDVGANTGQTAVIYNEKFPEATIYSFEPVRKTFLELVKNTKNNKRIVCNNLAFGDRKESIEINLYEGGSSNLNSLKKEVMSTNDHLKETIKVTTGDIFCEENNISEIDLLKIDTEGYEIKVLEGFSRMISESKIKAIYCEVGFSPLNKRNTYINELFDFARQNDFQFYGLYEVYNKRITEGNNFGNILFINTRTVNSL
ncbi:FkbM family methyltransferase [Salinimicrobium xinjiangense]|uniref:FkbM family methyltransferase n=1 Tax=Salinimicrobium xinjiangense TaxID=438596 RepID=UPI0004115217|nr:FkbM family methyltransferase [Salinimicrobium xinjiangense]